MEIVKLLNEDTVIALDSNKDEVLLYGKNIGSDQSKVNTNKIERILKASDNHELNHLIELISESELEDLKIVNTIVKICEEEMDKKIETKLFITLADHILFALERTRQSINFKNQLLKEIKKFYPTEFTIGKKALEVIKNNFGIVLPEDEAGYIALHLINAESNLKLPIAETTTRIINNSIRTIEFIHNVKISENSLNYKRFIRHLKNCINRAFSGTMLKDEDEVFFGLIKKKFSEYYSTAKKIANYIYNKYSILLTENEIINLTVYINRLINGR